MSRLLNILDILLGDPFRPIVIVGQKVSLDDSDLILLLFLCASRAGLPQEPDLEWPSTFIPFRRINFYSS